MKPIDLLLKLYDDGIRTAAGVQRFIDQEESALRGAKGFNRVRIVRRIRAAKRILNVLK